MRAGLLRHRALALIVGCALLAASCSLFRAPVPSSRAASPDKSASAQLAQLDFSRQASFGRCVPPACPTRTPKTLAPDIPNPLNDNIPAVAPANAVAADQSRPSDIPETPVPHTLTLQFALGSSRLSPAARTQLNQAMPEIASAQTIAIVGRTDSTGPLAFNESLAFSRALAVRDHLLKTHPALAPALTLKAQGACCFVASNDTLAGRAQNRRVEVILYRHGEGRPYPGASP